LGPTDTASNATINRASAAPATLVEMGSMVAWEKQHGNNFTSSSKFNELTTGLANAIASAVPKPQPPSGSMSPPSTRPRFESLQGKDDSQDTKFLIVNQQAKPQITGQGSQSAVKFVPMGDGRWKSSSEMTTQMRNLYMQRLAQ